MIELNEYQIRLLKPYEDTLRRCTFRSINTIYIDSQTLEDLASIYYQITGQNDCSGCSKDFVKRLSEYYFHSISLIKSK